MTSAAFGTCGDCNRPRKPGAIFCECGALLDYSAPSDSRTNGTSVVQAPEPEPETAADQAGDRIAKSNEWPPGPYHAQHEHTKTEQPPLRVRECPNCKALNPTRLLVCWNCSASMIEVDEAAEETRRRKWWLFFRRDRPPLRAGEREYPEEPFISRDPKVLLRAGLITAGLLLLLSALVVGLVKVWGPGTAEAAHGYGWTREKLFPRFTPHHPSSVRPPQGLVMVRGKKLPDPHPARYAFDRNLSTYWQSRTPKNQWDNLTVYFKPAIKQFTDVSVFAGDPTARTVVPRQLQFTFFSWDPHPDLDPNNCKGHNPDHFPLRPSRGTFCVIGDPKLVDLVNKPTEQRFSVGLRKNVARVVITVRGTHRTTVPKAKAAITDIEFFDRH